MDIGTQQKDINPSSEHLAMVLSRMLGNTTQADEKGSAKSFAASITNESKSHADGFGEISMRSEYESAMSPGPNTQEQLKPMITASPATASNEQSSVLNFPPNASPSTLQEPLTASSLSKRTIAQRERRAREREAKSLVVHGTPEIHKDFGNVTKDSAQKDQSFIINQVPTLKTYKRRGPSRLAQQSSPEYGRPKDSSSSDTVAPDPPDVHNKILSCVNEAEPGTQEDIMPLMSVSPMGTLIEWSSMNSGSGQTSVATKALSPSSLSSDLICKRGNLLYCEDQMEPSQHSEEKKKGDQSEQFRLKMDPITTGVEVELPDAAKCFQSHHIELVKGKEAEIVSHWTDPKHAGPYPEKRIPFVKTSVLWKSLESMETFQRMPQNPSFRQLETYNEGNREGIAIGLMVNFDNLVRRVGTLRISDSQSSFKEMLESLATFEENGFDVRPIQSRIEELLEIKEFQKQFKNKMAKLEEQLLVNANEDSRLDTQYCELDKTIMKMERKLASLHKEKDSVHNQIMAIRLKTANLQKDVQTAEEECLSVEQRFNTVVGSPW